MALSDHNNEDLLCRTCLEVLSEGDADENPKHNIFQTPELAKKLIACTAVELAPSDQYPKHICDCCYSKVNEFYKFRTMCVDSMERLRELSPSSAEEEPIFDLGSIVKMEIVVGEHEVLFQDDADTVGENADAAASGMAFTTSGHEKRCDVRLPIKVELVGDVEDVNNELHCDDNEDSLLVRLKELPFTKNKKDKKQPKVINLRCDVCSAQFDTAMLFNRHKRTHETYVCDICGETTGTRQELQKHINSHKKYTCQLCSRILSNAYKLSLHIRTVHEGVKDYACRHCDRKFGRWMSWKYHEMTHTGERPHECGQCGKRFIQRGALKTHLKIHTRDNAPLKT